MLIISAVPVTLFTIIVLIYFIPWLWRRRRFYQLSWNLPGPFALPFIGNILLFRDHESNIEKASYLCDKYKSPFRIWMLTRFCIVISDADDIETVLSSPHCLSKDDNYKYLQYAVQHDGLFTSQAKEWKRHRKLIGPSFSLSTVYNYVPIFNKRLKKLANSLETLANDGKLFDVRPHITSATIDMILETTLGHEIDAEEKATYSEHVSSKIQNIAGKRIFQPWYQIDWIWNMTSWPKVVSDFVQVHRKIMKEIYAKRSKEGAEKLLLVDRLIHVSEENDDFTYEDVLGECNTVMIAGTDTSAISIATTLLLLAIYPEHQEKVYRELKSILPESLDNYEITRTDIEQMVYTEQCIKETTRLIPIVAIISRKNTKEIRIGKYDFPPETTIVINLSKVHKDPKYWGENVNEFDPDRFAEDKFKQLHPYCYVAFSGGIRNCIGYKYALIVLKLSVAYILHKYRITTPLKLSDIKYYMDINTQFPNKHFIQLHKR